MKQSKDTPTTTEGWEDLRTRCDEEMGGIPNKMHLGCDGVWEWIAEELSQAELRGEEKGRKITEERVELANNGYLCPNCYSTEHKYCGIPVKLGNPFSSLTQEKEVK